MNFLDRILPKYNYNYFDAYNQLQTTQLNIFQCFARRVFGYYAETHLSNVVRKAYTVTLNDQCQAAPKKRQELLKLIAKAESVYAYNQSYMKLPSCNLSTGTEMSMSVRYNIRKPEKIAGDFKIFSIDFKLTFSRNNGVQETHHVSIFKNKSQRVVVHLPGNLFQWDNDFEGSIKQRLNSEYVRTISDLLIKILNDSSTVPEIQYYADDHRWMFHSLSSESLNPDNLNDTQEEAMNKLGWEYLNQFTKSGQVGVVDVRRVYLLRKEVAVRNQNLAALGFHQPLSIAFAASFLETQTREY